MPIVDGDIDARPYLVGVGGVMDVGRLQRPQDLRWIREQIDFADPVVGDLGDDLMAIPEWKGTVGAPEAQGRSEMVAVKRFAPYLDRRARPLAEKHHPAVLDVRAEHRPIGQHHGVVGVPQLVRSGSRNSRSAITPNDPIRAPVDDADGEVVLLGRDDLLPARTEERVVGNSEAVARRVGSRRRKLPQSTPVVSDLYQPIIAYISDQHRARKHRWITPGRE